MYSIPHSEPRTICVIVNPVVVSQLTLFRTQHASSLQLHPLTHHIVTTRFVDRTYRSDGTASQMDWETGWWTLIVRIKRVGRLQKEMMGGHNRNDTIRKLSHYPATSKLICLVSANQAAHQLLINCKGTMRSKPQRPVLSTQTEGTSSMV